MPDSLGRARRFAAEGQDEDAKRAYVAILQRDATHFDALNELGLLATASGHRSAARTAFGQAAQYHPHNPTGHVNLANLLFEDGDVPGARVHYEAALAAAPDLPQAHQGLARVLTELEDGSAEDHWHKGFAGHAVVTRSYRGRGSGIPLLLLVSARGGNIPTRGWINDRRFQITAVYMDFHDPSTPIPEHALVMNAIGDADLCKAALSRAEAYLAMGKAPVINLPSLVRATGRYENALRMSHIPDVVAPAMETLGRSAILQAASLAFPLLVRAAGFHTGRYFVRVENREALLAAISDMPGNEFLTIQYLDARGRDGLARKYRVMFIDGVVYPLHLAIGEDWKVHYFTAAMATNPAHREEERRFLEDMPTLLGERAMSALSEIARTMGLDYAGADFALSPDGSVLLFEANATMVVNPPEPDSMWDYRRRAVSNVIEAIDRMLTRRINEPVASRLLLGAVEPVPSVA